MKKVAVIVLMIVLCSIIVTASSGMILKVSSDDEISLKDAINDIRQHPFILYFKLGVYYFYQGRFNDAITAFRKAIVIKPDFAEAYHNIGVSYYELGDLDKAIPEFERAVEIDDDYVKGHYSLGLAYYHNKNYDKAITSLEKVVTLDPLNANALFDLGIVYVEMFRKGEEQGKIIIEYLEQGLLYYEKCLEIDPEFPHAKENKEIVEKVLDSYKSLFNN